MSAVLESTQTVNIRVGGNVDGSIVVGNDNFIVNTNYGTLVFQEAKRQVRLRDVFGQPSRPTRGFVGRDFELSTLRRAVAAGEAVLISGAEGLGKSALLGQIGAEPLASGLPHGVIRIEAVDERGQALGVDDVCQLLFSRLFEAEPNVKIDTASARTYLSNARPLVLLDGFNLSGAQLDALVDLTPNGAVLLTSPLALPTDLAHLLPLGPLERTQSLELLANRMGLADDQRSSDDANLICTVLADVPLAIRLTAITAGLHRLTLAQVREALLYATPASTEPTPAALQRAYAFVVNLTSREARQLLAVIAAAPGVSVAAAYAREALQNPEWFEAAVDELKLCGLLEESSPRLRLHSVIKALARPADKKNHYAALVGFLLRGLSSAPADAEFCTAELGNILGTLEWAVGQRRWAEAVALGRAVDPYLTLNGLWDAWKNVLERVLLAARSSNDPANEGWALHQLGTREVGVGEKGQAVEYLQRALGIRRSLGDALGAAHTQHNLNLLIPPLGPGGNGRPVSLGSKMLTGLIGSLAIVLTVLGGALLVNNLPPRRPAAEAECDLPCKRTLVAQTLAALTPAITATPTAISTATGTPTMTTTAMPSPTSTGTTTETPTAIVTPTPTRRSFGTHVVRAGETLYCLGRAYGVEPKIIAEVNGLPADARLSTGQALSIPDARWADIPAGKWCAAQAGVQSLYAVMPTWTPTAWPTATGTHTQPITHTVEPPTSTTPPPIDWLLMTPTATPSATSTATMTPTPTNQPPVVRILNPAFDVAYCPSSFDSQERRYASVSLLAVGIDPEDGWLSGDRVAWTTDQTDVQPNGEIVWWGNQVTIRLYLGDYYLGDDTQLPITVHTIFVTVWDGNRSSARDIRHITISLKACSK